MTPTLSNDARDTIAREVSVELAAARRAVLDRLNATLVGQTVDTVNTYDGLPYGMEGPVGTIAKVGMDSDGILVATCTYTDAWGEEATCDIAL